MARSIDGKSETHVWSDNLKDCFNLSSSINFSSLKESKKLTFPLAKIIHEDKSNEFTFRFLKKEIVSFERRIHFEVEARSKYPTEQRWSLEFHTENSKTLNGYFEGHIGASVSEIPTTKIPIDITENNSIVQIELHIKNCSVRGKFVSQLYAQKCAEKDASLAQNVSDEKMENVQKRCNCTHWILDENGSYITLTYNQHEYQQLQKQNLLTKIDMNKRQMAHDLMVKVNKSKKNSVKIDLLKQCLEIQLDIHKGIPLTRYIVKNIYFGLGKTLFLENRFLEAMPYLKIFLDLYEQPNFVCRDCPDYEYMLYTELVHIAVNCYRYIYLIL